MYPLFETIRMEEGRPLHLRRHEERLHASRRELFGATDRIDLGSAIDEAACTIPGAASGIVRCRVTYGERVGEVTFAPYHPRVVRSLALVEAPGLEYAHKYADRTAIDLLLASTNADDVLIARGGLVTDASHANVAFFDGSSWVTPEAPLLRGTTRERLLAEGALRTSEIRVADLRSFDAAVLMNAMIGFDVAHAIPTGAITGA